MPMVSLIPEATENHRAIGLDEETVSALGADASDPERVASVIHTVRPDLVFTSKTEAGGAATRTVVRRIVAALRPRPAVYVLEPHTLGEILSDVKTVGDATGRQQPARVLIEALRVRIDAVSLRSARALAEVGPRRIACLNGTATPVAVGWWQSELVGLAGGLDVLAGQHRPPRALTWAEIRNARPEVILLIDPESPHPQRLSQSWERGGIQSASPFPAHRERGPGGEGVAPGPRAIDLLEEIAALILPGAFHHC